jgi:heme exporter protein A
MRRQCRCASTACCPDPGPALASDSWFEVRELRMMRGQRQLLDGVAFTLAPGEALLVQGPNGSGKSSLLRGLLGLSIATGTLRFVGDEFAPATGRLRRHALYQGHAAGLKGELTALENLALAAALDGLATDARALRSAVAATGVAREATLAARRLSQGQKQRLVLARFALSNLQPAPTRMLWLLDEPSAALDSAGAAMLDDLLAVHLQRGGAVIAATHLPLLAGAAAGSPLPPPRRIELG